jgi:hypothetical protein
MGKALKDKKERWGILGLISPSMDCIVFLYSLRKVRLGK